MHTRSSSRSGKGFGLFSSPGVAVVTIAFLVTFNVALADAWHQQISADALFGVDFDADGNAYVGTYTRSDEEWRIHRVSTIGDIEWIVAGEGLGRSVRVCGETRICVATSESLTSLQMDTGDIEWAIAVGHSDFLPLADGRIAAYEYVPGAVLGSMVLRRLYSDAGVALGSAVGGRAQALLAGNEDGVLAYSHTSGSLRLIGSGSVDDRVLLDSASSPLVAGHSAHLHRSLRLTYLSRSTEELNKVRVVQVSEAGVNWAASLLDMPENYVLGATVLTTGSDGTVYVLAAVEPDRGLPGLSVEPASIGRAFHQIAAIDETGSLLWRRQFASDGSGDPWDATEPRHGRSAYNLTLGGDGSLLSSFPLLKGERLILRALDSGNGDLKGMRVLDCGGAVCERVAVRLDSEGRAVVVSGPLDLNEAHPGPWVQVRGGIDLISKRPVRLAQSGLNGVWYSPYVAGQGFTFRYHPGPGVVFMPWFTYTAEGGGANALRWYVVEGEIDGAADIATLPIRMRIGGEFNLGVAPPAVTVGSARLRFSSCSEGLIEYRFDPAYNDGAEGSMHLFRQLPVSDPCVGSEDEIIVSQADYDQEMSGTWYDPQTAGQGLDLFRVSSQPSGGPLPLFGAWYTFDASTPTGTASDQRWFTLQLQEVDSDGVVRTAIARTLHGRFDRQATRDAHRVGEAELVSLRCDAMRFRYVFDESGAAGEFSGLQGEIELRRLGECQD